MGSGKGAIVLGEVLIGLVLCYSLIAICYFRQGRSVGGVWLGWVLSGYGLVFFLLGEKDVLDQLSILQSFF